MGIYDRIYNHDDFRCRFRIIFLINTCLIGKNIYLCSRLLNDQTLPKPSAYSSFNTTLCQFLALIPRNKLSKYLSRWTQWLITEYQNK